MRFCSECAAPLLWHIPAGDHLPRHVCPACGAIHYQNPRLVVGCIAEYEGRILLCRRAIEPRLGYWTLPAGFMENQETCAAAALRETWEEAEARPKLDAPFALVNVPHISQVHLFYRGRLNTAEYAAGSESLEVALFAENEIPWSELAFRSVRFCLENYFADRQNGSFGFHTADLAPLPG